MSMGKPTAEEEAYFAVEEAEKLRQRALEKATRLGQQERERLRALHYMCCPKCGMALQELSVRDVVVDKCFHCHGLFLDEGELEKLSAHEGMWGQLRTFFAKKGRE